MSQCVASVTVQVNVAVARDLDRQQLANNSVGKTVGAATAAQGVPRPAP